jgi:hypothetical protein
MGASAGADTHLTVTTQACEKVYKADQDTANVNVRLEVGAGAALNWLPQETILFDKARLARTISVRYGRAFHPSVGRAGHLRAPRHEGIGAVRPLARHLAHPP